MWFWSPESPRHEPPVIYYLHNIESSSNYCINPVYYLQILKYPAYREFFFIHPSFLRQLIITSNNVLSCKLMGENV
jgi:hypothetical protein